MTKIKMILLITVYGLSFITKASDEISSFIDFSSDVIDQAILEMEDRRNVIVFEHPDYQRAFIQHAERVENALLEFNEKLNVEVLDDLNFMVNRYNSLYHSPRYSDDQRELLLRNEFDAIESYLADSLGPKYHHLIKDLMRDIFPLITGHIVIDQNIRRFRMRERTFRKGRIIGRIKVDWVYGLSSLGRPIEDDRYLRHVSLKYRGSGVSIPETRWFLRIRGSLRGPILHGSPELPDNMTPSMYDSLFSRLFNLYIRRTVNVVAFDMLNLNQMKNWCESRSCVLMYGADIIHIFHLIEEHINRSLEVRLADGRSVSLPQADLSQYRLIERIEKVFELLSESDLPFTPGTQN